MWAFKSLFYLIMAKVYMNSDVYTQTGRDVQFKKPQSKAVSKTNSLYIYVYTCLAVGTQNEQHSLDLRANVGF